MSADLVVVRRITNLHSFLKIGRNNIGVGGKLSYSPGEAPFLEKTKFTPGPVDPQDLTCLESIGLPAAVDCIINICPSVAFDGLVVNIDYQVS